MDTTFARLLGMSSRGPFKAEASSVEMAHDNHDGVSSICHASFERGDTTVYDMELIARLLNFAHAGGGKFLSELFQSGGERPSFQEYEHLETLVKILNGERQP
jgi:hypothetical protein